MKPVTETIKAALRATPLYPVLRTALVRFFASNFVHKYVDPVRAIFRVYGLRSGICALAFLCENHVRLWIGRRQTNSVNEYFIRQNKKSDTVFVFGSGASLNEISQQEWDEINKHDVISLNYFFHQRWVDVTIHLVREMYLPLREHKGKHDRRETIKETQKLANQISQNPRYRDTVVFLQTDFFSVSGKTIIGWGQLPNSQRVCFYRAMRKADALTNPPNSLKDGLPRQAGAVGAGISLARIFGWKHIVLIGVDLYNSRYFYLPPHKKRSSEIKTTREKHPTISRGIIETMAAWRDLLEHEERTLKVYNPRSLLRPTIPQFEWSNGMPVHNGADATATPMSGAELEK